MGRQLCFWIEKSDYVQEKRSDFLKIFIDFFREMCIILICMDTLIKRDSLGPDSLRNLSDHHILVGTKQLKKALKREKVTCVLLALDADPAITEELEQLCLQQNVNCSWVGKMSDLGRACGIDVGAAAVAIMPRSN